MARGRILPAIDWTHHDDPWYRLGVWCVIYGGIVAAPTLTVASLLGLMGVLGWLPLDGEFYALAAVGSVSGAIALAGLYLIRRSRRDRQRLSEIDESYWFQRR
jgi:hypothetical protein